MPAPYSRSSAASSSKKGGRAAGRSHTCRHMESTSHFRIVVSTFTKITDRGHPWRMPWVACHDRPRAPAILKARRSYLYMVSPPPPPPISVAPYLPSPPPPSQ